MLFSLLKHYLDTDTVLKVSQSVYCFTISISHGVENYFPRLWGTAISDAISFSFVSRQLWYRVMSTCLFTEVKWQWVALVLGWVIASVHHSSLYGFAAHVSRPKPLLDLFFFCLRTFMEFGIAL